MTDKNDVVIINLDRPRELRFGHKALKKLSAATGKSMEELEGDSLDFEHLEQIFLYGLEKDARENGETLTPDKMEEILDFAESYEYLMEKMTEAMNKAMGSFGGNVQAAGKPLEKQRTKAHSIGKSH